MKLIKKKVSETLASLALLITFSFALASLSKDSQAMPQSPEISFKRHSVYFG